MGKTKEQETVIFSLPANVKKEFQLQAQKDGTSIQKLLETFVYCYLQMEYKKKEE